VVSASDGVALHAEAHGDGVPVLFSCAFCTTSENWRGQVEPLVAAGYRVVLWDYRGHGRSGAPEDPAAYDFDQVVRDLESVLDWAAPGEAAVLAGLSFGGLASLHFAHRQPARVRALVLAGSGPGFKNPEAQKGWEEQVERTASFLEARGFDDFVAGKAGRTVVGLAPDLPAAKRAASAIRAQSVPGVAAFARGCAGPAPCIIDELAEIGAPALVIVGDGDRPYLRAAEVMAAKLPNARHRQLENAGHLLNIEQAAAFDAAVLEFLAEVAS